MSPKNTLHLGKWGRVQAMWAAQVGSVDIVAVPFLPNLGSIPCNPFSLRALWQVVIVV